MSCGVLSSQSDFAFSPIQDFSSSSAAPSGPEYVQPRPVDVPDKEKASLQHLFKTMKRLTPHMEGSFVLDEQWWENNSNNSCLHVSLISKIRSCVTSDAELIPDVQVRSLPSTRNDRKCILRSESSDASRLPENHG